MVGSGFGATVGDGVGGGVGGTGVGGTGSKNVYRYKDDENVEDS